MPDLPEVREKFVADTSAYARNLREAARDADRFGEQNTRAALAARKMGLAAKEGADKAARAQRDAAQAAERLARGEIEAGEAAEKAAAAERELERASIKAAEAERASAHAADQAADQYRQLARDAELAAAAERLGALKSAGAVKEHNDEVRRLRGRFGDLEKSGGKAFREIETEGSRAYQGLTSAGEKFGELGPLWIVGIANAIAFLPAAASVAGGGIALGLGAGLSAVGILAASKSAEVRHAFSGLKTDVSHDLTSISAPWRSTLDNIAHDADMAWHGVSGTLKSAFAEMAPAVSRFSGHFSASLIQLNPAITSIDHAFVRVLDTLGPHMGPIMNNFGTSIKAITDAVAANPGAFTGFVEDISKMARYTGDAIGFMIRFKDHIQGFFAVLGMGTPFFTSLIGKLGDLKSNLPGMSHGFDIGGGSFASFAQQAALAAVKTQGVLTAEQAAALTSKQLADAMKTLTGAAQSAFDAETQYRQALVAANEQAKKSNAGFDGNSKAALANRQALSQLAQAIKANMEAGKLSSTQIENMRAKFVKAAEGMGATRKEAEGLARQLLGLKPPPPIKLSMSDADFMFKLHRAQGLRIDPKTGLLKGNNSDYFNKWLRAKGLRIDPKTGLFKGNNADYYNKWLKANGLKINPKTGQIRGNTAPFWASVHSIPAVVGTRTVDIHYNVSTREKVHAEGGIDRYADGGMRHDLPPHVAYQPTVLYGEPETGGEAYIPLGEGKRHRSVNLLDQVAKLFGLELVKPMASGGLQWTKSVGAAPPMSWTSTTEPTPYTPPKWWTKALARPEHLAALASQNALAAMRTSSLGSWSVAGLRAGVGSGHGTVVQHVTNVSVNVAGSVRSDRDIAAMIQQQLLRGRMATTLPAGR